MIRVVTTRARPAGNVSAEVRTRAYELRRKAHEHVMAGECEGTGHDPKCEACECAWYCTEARHMRGLFLF